MSDTQQPQEEQSTILAFEGFSGLDTAASRPGIKDTAMAWSDGWMPLGDSNLRTLYGIGPSIFTTAAFTAIECFDFGNIATDPYMIAFPSDGSIVAVHTDTKVANVIGPPGTIANVARNKIGVTQWGSVAIIIVAQQPNGYFVFDGTLLYGPGGLSPFEAGQLIDGGAAYTSVPSYTVYGGSGSGVVLTPVITDGTITDLIINNPGTGYLPGDIVQVGFQGGGTDTTPILEAVLVSGNVAFLTLIAGGSGYTNGTFALAFSGGGGTGAAGTFVVAGGVVTSVALTAGGHNYTSAPAVSFAASSGGSGAVAIAALSPGAISSVTIIQGGTNLSGTPLLTVVGGGGSGATLVANVSGGTITSVSVTNGGSGFSSVPAIEVQTGLNNAAAAILTVMPFGISGAAAETYQSRVWVANPFSTNPQGAGGTVNFSGPGSYTDFSTASGGGSFTSNDSFLRVAYTGLIQTNGFLYLIGDSSVNYIGGVTTSGNPPQTSFTNQNADPETGTPYPGTIDVLGSNIVFANAWGVQVSYGGRVAKVSEPLDGFFSSAGNTFEGNILSAAKAIVFGKRIWMVLVFVIDQFTGVGINKLCCWSPDQKKWFTSQQDVVLIYINGQEIASVETAYGTDGTNVYPLFAQPSTGFTKVVQSKLWAKPGGYMQAKASNRVWLVAQYFSDLSPDIQFSTANDANQPATVTLTPVLATPPEGFYVSPPTANGQTGTLLGITLVTNAADVALVSAAVDAEVVSYRG